MIDIERLLANDLPSAPRSRCFRLEPREAGTPRQESLRSYAVRLSDEHNLSATKLLSALVPPLKRADDLAKLVPSWYSMKRDLSANLNELTMRTDLDKLTMLPWENVVASEGLYYPTLRWCPHCVRQDGRKGPYERLLWNIRCVKACPYDRALLREVCPACGSKPARDTTRNVQERCHVCHADLRMPMDGVPTEKDLYVAANIGRLIADAYHGQSAHPDRLKEVWERIVFPLFETKIKAATHLGLTEALIYQSGTYTKRLKLKHWVQISWMLQVSLSDLLLKDISLIKPHLRPAEPVESKPRVTKRELREKAFQVAQNCKGRKLSVRRLAREMGVGTTRIRTQLPGMARGLSLQRRRDLAKTREKKIILLIQLAHRAKSAGLPVSMRAAQREMKCRSGAYFESLLAEASRRLNGEYFAF
jgi:hypothetical protein